MEFEKNKRTWDREDMIAKYEFEWSKFTSEKDYEAAIAEAKAQGDHERALALAKAKEQFRAEFNPSDSDAKGKREDIGRYREAALVEFTSSLFPEGMSTMDPRTGEAIDVEKMGVKSYINILKQSDNPQDRAKADVLAETNRKAQNAKTPEDIDRIFAEQRAKLEDTDPLGIR